MLREHERRILRKIQINDVRKDFLIKWLGHLTMCFIIKIVFNFIV